MNIMQQTNECISIFKGSEEMRQDAFLKLWLEVIRQLEECKN